LRSTAIGSTVVARRAGTQHAHAAASSSANRTLRPDRQLHGPARQQVDERRQ
jgi:hypothetical protein